MSSAEPPRMVGPPKAAVPGPGAPGESECNDRFGRQRAARRSMLAEDYVELIADLIDGAGKARAVDLARRFGVAHATVVKALGRLERQGLVANTPYRGVDLTAAGRDLALAARDRHAVVKRFLLALGVSEATAAADAEGIEHHVSAETLEAFRSFAARRA